MNKRLKTVRKALGLNQTQFGRRLGVTPTAISILESGKRNFTDQMILALCKEYNIDETWLRTGDGEMFRRPDTFSLDEYAANNNLSDLETYILKGFMSLDEKTQQTLMDHFKKMITDRQSETPMLDQPTE